MKVRDGLAAVATIVDDDAKAVIGESFFAGDVGGGEQEVAEPGLIGDVGLSHTCDGLARDHQDVNGCLRGDVAKGDAVLVFMDEGGRNFAVADFFEKGLFSHVCAAAWHLCRGSARPGRSSAPPGRVPQEIGLLPPPSMKLGVLRAPSEPSGAADLNPRYARKQQ